MINKLKNLKFFQVLLISASIILFSPDSFSYAQGEAPSVNTEKEFSPEKRIETEEDGNTEQSEQEKQTPPYQVLGRKLTPHEKELYGDLGVKELKAQLLHKEYKLVVVRALLAIGEGQDLKRVLDIIPTTEQKTFNELVEYFSTLKEKYGYVLKGLETEFVQNIKDEKYAFKNAASAAYKQVFGAILEESDTQQLLDYFTGLEIRNYSEMIENLRKSLTPEDKREILVKALIEVGRPDLQKNAKFMEKILGQDFTYANLMELFKPLKKTTGKLPTQKTNK